MEVVVTTGTEDVQISSEIVTTNKPTPSFFTGRMSFLLPNQQCQSSERITIDFQLHSGFQFSGHRLWLDMHICWIVCFLKAMYSSVH